MRDDRGTDKLVKLVVQDRPIASIASIPCMSLQPGEDSQTAAKH